MVGLGNGDEAIAVTVDAVANALEVEARLISHAEFAIEEIVFDGRGELGGVEAKRRAIKIDGSNGRGHTGEGGKGQELNRIGGAKVVVREGKEEEGGGVELLAELGDAGMVETDSEGGGTKIDDTAGLAKEGTNALVTAARIEGGTVGQDKGRGLTDSVN